MGHEISQYPLYMVLKSVVRYEVHSCLHKLEYGPFDLLLWLFYCFVRQIPYLQSLVTGLVWIQYQIVLFSVSWTVMIHLLNLQALFLLLQKIRLQICNLVGYPLNCDTYIDLLGYWIYYHLIFLFVPLKEFFLKKMSLPKLV
ncbi:hypothetical protein ABY63_09740 [Klebsiella pneumoniae]|nr:hypothetical protein ABY63_09740 [Klebsiella pneumoniae]AWB64409.1 hypothetical protein CUC76_23970 [Enterobacteriaceae bacterium S05]PLG16130.1 hypothetical protein B6J05_21390 [Klebsiella quasipneumoniae]ROC14544.1 hypothetical protein C4Z37_016535 [Klebsiella pneumoniae subsp. pneumoniae]KSV38224.1 hypothetical protein AT479_08605 [Klebsiella pneumoniae]